MSAASSATAVVHAAPDASTQTHPCGVYTWHRGFWDRWTRDPVEVTCRGCAAAGTRTVQPSPGVRGGEAVPATAAVGAKAAAVFAAKQAANWATGDGRRVMLTLDEVADLLAWSPAGTGP